MVSPLGRYRLGGSNSRPEHSMASWLAMMFSAGMGTGLLFWGGAEPLYHVLHPPIQTGEVTLTSWAMFITLMHWGLHPWALYAISAVLMGAWTFKNGWSLGSILRDLPALHRIPRLSFLTNLLMFVAILVGVATTFATGIILLEAGLLQLFPSWEASVGLRISLLVGLFLAYLASALSGLSRGIVWLSNVGSIALIVLLLVVAGWLMQGQTIQQFISELPQLLPQLPALSVGLVDGLPSAWVSDWTVKYWSWWLAWTPFVSLFIALISKGRTIRQVLLVGCLIPTVFSAIWFLVWGDAALALNQVHHWFNASSYTWTAASHVVFQMAAQLPFPMVWVGLTWLLVAIFFVNSADSATLTMAQLSSNPHVEKASASISARLAWGSLLGAVCALFLASGGVGLLQQVTLLLVWPFSVLLVLMGCVSLRQLYQSRVESR